MPPLAGFAGLFVTGLRPLAATLLGLLLLLPRLFAVACRCPYTDC
jgi:hypothetical protein